MLTKLKIIVGIYHGLLVTDADTPEINLAEVGTVIAKAEVKKTKEKNAFSVEIVLPSELISDGAHVFQIIDAKTSDVLDYISIIAGKSADENLSARLDHLQAELDLVKSVLRKLGKN